METVVASAPPLELIELSDLENPFRKLKECSVLTHGLTTLLRHPWSGFHRRSERGLPSISLETPEGPWSVRSRLGSLVGTYERSVFKALEWIAIDASVLQGVPFANPLVVHPRDLCERLCWRATQPQFEAIEQSMRDLCQVEIEHGSARFGLLRAAIAGTQRTVNRSQTCPQFVVYFDRYVVDSMNAGRIRPINWGLWIALRDPVAQRLLEILDPEFTDRDGAVTARLEADVLAGLLPLASRSRRRAVLEQAHAALRARGYLASVERRSTGSSDVYVYRAGPTRLAMQHFLGRRLRA
jgi:hypothetical protein